MNKEIREKICENCKWFEKWKDDKYRGSCHRYPQSRYGYLEALFPRAFKDGWCGEFKPK